jgi:FAD:protein FMN transferase
MSFFKYWICKNIGKAFNMNIHFFQSMGTHYQFVGISEQMRGEMKHWLQTVDDELSRFSPNSELNHLNQSAGIPVRCAEILWEVIVIADHYFRETEGIFHPYLGRVLSGIGYDKSFEKIDPNQFTSFQAGLLNIEHPISLNHERKEVILNPLVSVDLGGIAKGWCAKKISSWAKQEGIACGVINAGGDMVIWGNEDDQGWEVNIENPWDPNTDLIYLRVTKEVGLATSNLVKRKWGEGYHHIIDPRTQTSSSSDLIQVTIISPDLIMAEVYTKVLLILGSEQGIYCIQKRHPHLAYLLVKTDRTVIVSPNLHTYASEWHLI